MTVTLQCCVCQTRIDFQVTTAEMGSLKESGACFKTCGNCKRGTYWAYPSTDRLPGLDRRVFHQSTAVPFGPPAPHPAPPASLKPPETPADGRPASRGPRRVALELPVRVRALGLDILEEITVTSNVSKTGLYFLSDKPFQVGQELRVAMNYSKSSSGDLEQRAQVVRIVMIPGNPKRGIGVKYL